MSILLNFIQDFLGQFFVSGFWGILKGIGQGFINIFNIPKYIEIFDKYSSNFGAGEWALAILSILLIVAVLAAIVFVIVLLLRKYIRVRKTLVDQEELLNEVGNLNREVIKLNMEKQKILAMKVSQLGLRPDESPYEDLEEEKKEEEEVDKTAEDYSRFYKLTQVDLAMKNYVQHDFDDDITLPEFCERFRNFACSRLGLFYEIDTLRLFISGFAAARLIILQGISGTGKTSLPMPSVNLFRTT